MKIFNKIDEFLKRYYLDKVSKLCFIFLFLHGHYTRDIFEMVFWGLIILFFRIGELSEVIYSALYVEEENGD